MRVERLVNGEYAPGFRCRELRGARFKSDPLGGNTSSPGSARISGPGYEAKIVNGKVWEATYRTNGWTPTKFTSFTEYANAGGPDWKGPTLAPNPKAPSTTPANLKKAAALADSGGRSDGEGGGGAHAGGDGEISFESIEALAPIDVEGIVADIGRINRGEFDANLEQSFGAARGITQGIFEDFNTFVDSVLPGARDLIGSASREVLNFINKGMPSAVQNNAILRDAGAMGAGGIAGDIAIRRSLYNEAQRDMAAVQYGIGQAQSLVDSARNVGMQFAQIEAQNTQAFLGQLNSLTMISPGQAVGFAFDERNYQTGVAQFNATGNFNESSANAQMRFNYAQLAQQNAQFQQQMAMEQQAQRDAQKSALFGLGGTLLGAGLGSLIPGVGTAIGMGIGAQIGGGLGSALGGNYAGATQGLMGGLGTYAGYQTGMEQMKLQREQMEQTRRMYQDDLEFRRSMTATLGGGSPGTGGYYPGISSAPWRPYTPGPTMQGWGNYGGLGSGIVNPREYGGTANPYAMY